MSAARQLAGTILAVSLALGSAFAQAPRFGGVRVELRPNPRVIPADGQSSSTVRVELRDNDNRAVPDGTTVVFRIEGGSLSAGGGERRSVVTVQTTGGVATVWATSTAVGTATVHAEAVTLQGRNSVQLYFTQEGVAPIEEARVLHVRGGWVGYGYEVDMVEARAGENGPARLTFGSVEITADMAQIDVQSLVVKATDATLSVGDQSISGRDLQYELMSGQGRVRTLGESGVERFCFNCYTMQQEPMLDDGNSNAFAFNSEEAATWAVAKSISIYPYEKIVLRNGSLYVEGKRILRLPKYWLIARPGYMGTTHSQVLSVNSNGQVGLDFPYVYGVTDTRTSSVKLQRGAASGTIIARDEWSLALEEAYETDKTTGAIMVAGLPRNDWGLEWTDSRELGQRREGQFRAYSPDHRSAYVDASVYQWNSDFRTNLRGYYNRPQGMRDSYGVSADWLTYNRPVGKWAASYRLGTGLGVSQSADAGKGIVGEHQIYAALDFPQQRVGRRATLRPSLSNLFVWDTSGYHYESARAELAMRQIISSEASVGLSYRAQFSTGDGGRGFEHLLDMNLSMYHGSRWQSYLTATYELDDSDTYAYWLLDYFPHRKWRVGLGATYYNFDGAAYDDFEVTLARRISGREIGLRWSRESDTISLELGGFGGLVGL